MSFFAPRGATRCTDRGSGEIWSEEVDSFMPNFTSLVEAAIAVDSIAGDQGRIQKQGLGSTHTSSVRFSVPKASRGVQ